MTRIALLSAVLAAAASAASAATYTLNIQGPMDLGSVAAAASGDTVFRIDPATGSVIVLSGTGRRLSTTSARAQVTITCRPSPAGETTCLTANIPIRIGVIGALVGRARPFSAFSVAMGTATLVGTPTGSNPLDFTLAPLGDNSAKTFFVGGDFPVAGDDSSQASGDGENAFYVYPLDPQGLNMGGDTDRGRVKALRALSATKTSDLNFGRIQIPSSGSSTITLNASTGNRTISGNAVGYATPTPTRASFTVAGEGGQQVSLTIPSTLSLTGPGTLNVSLTDTAPNSPSLSGALGAAGAYSFNVGGSFTITPTTPTGDYTGVLTISVDYN